VWRQEVYGQMTYGELAQAFEELAREDALLSLPDRAHLAEALKRPFPDIHLR